MENLETKEAVQDVVDEFLDYLSNIRWFSVVIIQSMRANFWKMPSHFLKKMIKDVDTVLNKMHLILFKAFESIREFYTNLYV